LVLDRDTLKMGCTNSYTYRERKRWYVADILHFQGSMRPVEQPLLSVVLASLVICVVVHDGVVQ
jgi:hypothetical protein